MKDSYCVTKVSGRDIDGGSVSCLGSHVKNILQLVSNHTKDCVWFVVDIDFFQDLDFIIAKKMNEPYLFGTTQQLIQFVELVDQFISGIFMAIHKERIPIKWEGGFFTEDTIIYNINDCVIQIRAYDTTFLEIYAPKKYHLNDIAQAFHSAVVCH